MCIMFDSLFFNKLDVYIYSILEDVFVVFTLYSFLKLILLSSLLELIWPTQFFNRRNSMGTVVRKYRTYVEVFVKLRSSVIILPSQFILSISFS